MSQNQYRLYRNHSNRRRYNRKPLRQNIGMNEPFQLFVVSFRVSYSFVVKLFEEFEIARNSVHYDI